MKYPSHFSVTAEWSEPQQPGKLDGRPAVQGEPQGIREAGQGLCRTILDGLDKKKKKKEEENQKI